MTIPAELLQALAVVTDETGAPLANDKSIKDLVWTGNRLAFTIEMGYPAASRHPAIREALQQAARALPLARLSQQPRAPQKQGGPAGSMTWWPSSGWQPPTPRYS